MTTPNEIFKNAAVLPAKIQELAAEARQADKRTAEARGLFWAAIKRGDAEAADRLEETVEAAELAASRAWRKARRADIENGQERHPPR